MISDIFDLPVTTLNDWEKKNSRKNRLYTFLMAMDEETITQQFAKKQSHRIFHILNRNIAKEEHYAFDEIRQAFLKDDYSNATKREQTIYAKFFKECDVEDLESFVKLFNVSKRAIKKIYRQIPERSFSGVSKTWDKRFRLKHINNVEKREDEKVPLALQNILKKRA